MGKLTYFQIITILVLIARYLDIIQLDWFWIVLLILFGISDKSDDKN